MKKLLLVLMVCLVSTAQAENRGYIRNDSGATLQGTNLEPSSASVTATGDQYVTLKPPALTGWTPLRRSALTNTVVTNKGTPGVMGGYHCYNPAAAVTYLQIFDVASATTVTLGTTVPDLSFGIPAGGGGNLEWANGVAFTLGTKIAATTTATGSTAPATALDCNFFYK